MAGLGRIPKDPALQRRPGRGIARSATELPASGRQGAPPSWPLPTSRPRELEIWAELWATPQAVRWEELGAGVAAVVARLTHLSMLIELGAAKAVMLGEVRQLEDRLGLSPLAMARLGWRVAYAEPVAVAPLGDIRGRILPVDVEERMREVGT